MKIETIILEKLSGNLEFFGLQQIGVNWLRLTDPWHCQKERCATCLDTAHISREVFPKVLEAFGPTSTATTRTWQTAI